MIPPDQEIYEVERRIALRRSQMTRHSRQAGSKALQALASPVALIGAAALGFFLAGGLSKRKKEKPHPERRKSDHAKAAKATGIASLVPLAMWIIKAQWGSPVNFATTMLEKFQKKKRPASSPDDIRSTTRTISCP